MEKTAGPFWSRSPTSFQRAPSASKQGYMQLTVIAPVMPPMSATPKSPESSLINILAPELASQALTPVSAPGRRSSSASASTSAARTSKKRTGCQQCKRRKVKCDEKQPVCSRCESHGDTCTGNFRWDTWQIERPWISSRPGVVSGRALEDESLRYWYDKACLNMAMLTPPANPLSYPLASLIRRSTALRHTVQSVANAHRVGFCADRLDSAWRERSLAVVALRMELERVQGDPNRQLLVQTIYLSSLILCVSSSWLDPMGKEYGLEFFMGAKGLSRMLCQPEVHDDNMLSFYLLGLFAYCEAFWSYLVPPGRQRLPDDSILLVFQQPPFASMAHPVTGIATTLCPILAEIGYYYRRVAETKRCERDLEVQLRRRLIGWEATNRNSNAQMVELAEGYRSLGHVMLYQALMITEALSDDEQDELSAHVLAIMGVLATIPERDGLLLYAGPQLMIAGSELTADQADQRRLVEKFTQNLAEFTNIPVYTKALEITRCIWQLRDVGITKTWLELMVDWDQFLSVA